MLISFTFQIYKNVKIVSQATISPDNFDSFNKIVKYTWFVFFFCRILFRKVIMITFYVCRHSFMIIQSGFSLTFCF